MDNYHCTWQIDVKAVSPQEACQQAWDVIRDKKHKAVTFRVVNTTTGETGRVELEELD